MKNTDNRQDIEIVKMKSEIIKNSAETHALRDLLNDFISNHFAHLRNKVDKILFLTITLAVSFIIMLIGVIVKLLFF